MELLFLNPTILHQQLFSLWPLKNINRVFVSACDASSEPCPLQIVKNSPRQLDGLITAQSRTRREGVCLGELAASLLRHSTRRLLLSFDTSGETNRIFPHLWQDCFGLMREKKKKERNPEHVMSWNDALTYIRKKCKEMFTCALMLNVTHQALTHLY